MVYSYTMDQRNFNFSKDLEYEEIAILDADGTIFYISQEGKESKVIFPTESPGNYWFKKEERPLIFKAFLNLYKDLGEIDYKIYGIRKSDGSIYFFDLKIDLNKNFYHEDFKILCDRFSIPMCQEYFSGSFSLKTIKKLITKTGKDSSDLFFKPLQENTFGLKKEKKEKKQKIKKYNKENKSFLSFSETEILKMIEENFNSPELFTSLENYDFVSLQEYVDFFCSDSFKKIYIALLEQELIDIVPANRFLIVDRLTKEISELIFKYASLYQNYIYADDTSKFISIYKKEFIEEIKKDIRSDIVTFVDSLQRNYVFCD